jgi:ribose transport system substrate-binding protein
MDEGFRPRRGLSRREFLGLAAAGAGMVVLGGCGSGGGGNQGGGGQSYNLALIVGVIGDEFYTSMGCGAKAEAKKLGASVKVQGPQTFDPSQQTPVVNAVIQSKPDAILIAPTDKTAMIGPIQSAVNQNIPVFTVDTFIAKPIALSHISSDNLEGGKLAAKALADAIGKKGKVLCINVTPGISTTDQRQQGFEEGLKKYPNIKYLGTQFCQDDPTKAASIASATLQSNPDLAGIFGANLFSGEGAASGVRQAGKQDQVKIVTFDASPTQVRDLKQGNVDALIAQHPNDIGKIGVKMAVDYLKTNKKPAKKTVKTGLSIVTRNTVSDPKISKYLYKAQC